MARANRKTSARAQRRAAPAQVGNHKEAAASRPATDEGQKEAAMQDVKVEELTGKALEAATVWAEANQRVLNQLVEFGTGAAKESIRLYAEWQQNALDAFRDSQATALRWQSGWQEAPRDPMAWYQKAVAESVDGTQKWFHIVETNAQAVTKSAERLQASAEQTGRGIQKTFTETVDRMKDTYARG